MGRNTTSLDDELRAVKEDVERLRRRTLEEKRLATPTKRTRPTALRAGEATLQQRILPLLMALNEELHLSRDAIEPKNASAILALLTNFVRDSPEHREHVRNLLLPALTGESDPA